MAPANLETGGEGSANADILSARDRLVREIDRHRGLSIAVSGGIDSMLLAFVAHRFGGDAVTMVHAVSPAVPPHATARVRDYAAREGWALEIVAAGEFEDDNYLSNPVNRCYFCKSNLYNRIGALGRGVIASGANLDDLGDYRPGLKAASERAVVHPYVDAGIDKATVRALARMFGLDDLAVLPAQPCLASRVETGIPIRADDLLFIDRVENEVRRLSGRNATLRCRVTAAGIVIELEDALLPMRGALGGAVAALCAEAGRAFAGVRPYRRGSAFIGRTETAGAEATRG